MKVGKVVKLTHQPHLPLRRHVVAQWLRHCDINRKVAGSIPDGVIGVVH
jgi:hypothetical protein